MNGWSVLQPLGVLPSGHPTRIAPVLGLSGNNPTVSFQFSGRGGASVDYPTDTRFLIERSSDRRAWVPVTVVTDGGAGDTNPASGQITVTDTATLGTNAIYYRVIAL